MSRPEDQTLGAIDDTSGVWVGVRLATFRIRRDLHALLSLNELHLDAQSLDFLADVGRQLTEIDDLTRAAQQETTELRRAYREWKR